MCEKRRMEAVLDVADVHVGTPPPSPSPSPGPLQNWAVRKVHFHGFAGLPTTRNEAVYSPEFSCSGHQWSVIIYPGGEVYSREGRVSVYLRNESPESMKAEYKILMKHPADHTHRTFETFHAGSVGKIRFNRGTHVGLPNFAKRETALIYLNNGTLTLELHLKTNKQAEPHTTFVPPNPINDNILKGFNDEEVSDVIFEVSGEFVSTANRQDKLIESSATTFHAGHLILRLNAPSLADMCTPGDEAAVPINGVEPEVFKTVLYFCYGGTIEEEKLAANTKEIIEAADRFGVVNLKLQAEAVLTEQTEITVDNMLDNLLYANSKNLALFQEKIMDFVAENGNEIVGKVSFDDVPGSLMSDLLTAFARGQKSTSEASQDELKFMRVGELRKRLHDKGLCIDGSRETMISLLRENSKGDADEQK